MDKYGQKSPPDINLENIKDVPIALFVGTEDPWSVEEGANWALDRLPKDTEYHLLEHFDH